MMQSAVTSALAHNAAPQRGKAKKASKKSRGKRHHRGTPPSSDGSSSSDDGGTNQYSDNDSEDDSAILRRRARTPFQPDRNIQVPSFDGSGNVDGFFRMFERICDAMGCNSKKRYAYLISKLSGAAAALVAGEEDALDLDYRGLKKLLVSHFQGERTTHVRKLKNLRLGSDLVKFNTDFALLAASATPLLGKWSVKEQYLDVVEARVGTAIRLKQD